MAETSFLFFFLLALAQRSSSLSWSVPDLSNSENATSQISASSSTNYGLNVASDAQSFSAISRRPGPVLYPVTTTSASASAPIFSITQIFVPETTTINKNAPSGPVSSASGRSAVPSLPVSSGSAGSESGMPDSVTLVTTTGSAPTSTFVNAVHVSNPPPSDSLSSSTTIFTTFSLSSFTSNGQVHTTTIPMTSTSVSMVPVPTHSAVVKAAAKTLTRLTTTVVVGVAIGAVAIFLSFVLCYIINRRRHLRNRAFLRLGEEI